MNASGVSMHPDGKTVVFTRDGKLWVDVLGTNQPRQFSASPFPNDRASGAQFSPDGKKVLAIARDEQWILAYPSGAAYKLPSDRLLYTSTWLPDSRHLLEIENSPPSYYFNSNLFLVDTETVTRRRVYSSGEFMLTPALSPDGRRLAYSRGLIEWNVLEIMIPSGTVRTALGGSGVIWGWPDWAPSGNHFLVATARSGPLALEDVSSSEGFSRRLYGGEPNEIVGMGRWSPDGSRFAFLAGGRSSSSVQLRIANSSGGRATTVVDHNVGAGGAPSWSPDGQWIAYIQAKPLAVAKIRADATGGPAILVELSSADVPGWTGDRSVQWSPPGKEIAYPTARGVMVVSPDSKTTRLLTARKFIVFGFSREGARLYGIERDTAGKGAQWQLYEVNVATGADKALGAVDLPASTDALTGFSMHPDGTRFLTSIAKWPYDIWMIEGLNPPKSWIDRFLRR
jgi:TolB protein